MSQIPFGQKFAKAVIVSESLKKLKEIKFFFTQHSFSLESLGQVKIENFLKKVEQIGLTPFGTLEIDR